MSGAGNGLPVGWVWATVGELTRYVTSGSRGWAEHYSEHGPLFLRVGNLDRGTVTLDLSSVQRVSPPEGAEGRRTSVSPNDVLLSITADVGLVGHASADLGEAYISQHVALLRPVPALDSRCLAWSLNDPQGFQRLAQDVQYGVTKASLSLSQVRNFPLPLPPLNEQKRIVAKIEALQERSKAAKEALDAIPPLLEKFRQSVLAAAFRGDLTAEWRRQNPDVEPASVLLGRIRAERRRRWEEAKPGKKYVEPEPVDPTGLPELPEGWCWARAEELCESITDGDHQPPPQTDDGVPFLVIGNVSQGVVDTSRCRYVAHDYYERLHASRRPRAGDVLYTVTGSYGITVAVTSNEPFCVQRHIAILRPHSEISPNALRYALSAPLARQQADAVATGTAQMTVPLNGLRNFMLPVPSKPESRVIVDVLDSVLAAAASTGRQASRQLLVVKRLDKSILAKAFRGELVPQDPTDEPASALLERIQAERASTTARPKRGRRPAPAA